MTIPKIPGFPKSSRKKLLALLVVFVGIALVSVAVFFVVRRFLPKPSESGPLSSNASVTLEYWGMFVPEEVMAPLISEYKKIHPNVTIVYTERKFEEDLGRYKRSLLTRLKEGSGPVIFRIHSTWVPEYISEISLSNTSISLEEYKGRFYPVAEDQCVTESGGILCIPLMYDGLALFYNKDMFDAAGVPEPKTWEEVREAAIRLTKRGQEGKRITRAGIALGTARNVANSTDVLGLMLVQSNVSIPKAFDTQSAASALEFYTDFVRVSNVWDSGMPYSPVAFATSRVAMMFGTRSRILDILNLNPTLRFVVLPVPQIPTVVGETTNDAWASFWVESVSADATEAEQKAAWDFLVWLSEEDQQVQRYSEGLKYQRFGEIPGNKNLLSSFSRVTYIGPIVAQAPNAKTSIVADLSGNDEYADIIKDMIESVSTSRRNKAAFEALKVAKDKISEL